MKTLKLSSLLLLITVCTSSWAGLVQVHTSNHERLKGKPVTTTEVVTLANDGEIRVTNVSKKKRININKSTKVVLNGKRIPVHKLANGSSIVFPVDAGTQILDVTVRGKHGSSIDVTFYEDKPEMCQVINGEGFTRDRMGYTKDEFLAKFADAAEYNLGAFVWNKSNPVTSIDGTHRVGTFPYNRFGWTAEMKASAYINDEGYWAFPITGGLDRLVVSNPPHVMCTADDLWVPFNFAYDDSRPCNSGSDIQLEGQMNSAGTFMLKFAGDITASCLVKGNLEIGGTQYYMNGVNLLEHTPYNGDEFEFSCENENGECFSFNRLQ